MMHVNDPELGKCELEIMVAIQSAVDSFIMSGYSIDLDRPLTERELDDFNEAYIAEIQMYSLENGSRNHN